MTLRKATIADTDAIWNILQQAIEQRRIDGSEQWQNGYPNLDLVIQDIENDISFVFIDNEQIIACGVVIFGVDPNYEVIDGKWLTVDKDYAAVHRVATINTAKGRGVATVLFQEIEKLCIKNQVFSIKVDTNFDNKPMLRILEKLNYNYCGEIFFNNAFRKAFEKVLVA